MKKQQWLLCGVISLILLIIGMSYSFWVYHASQNSINQIITDCLKIDIIDETAAINLTKAYPISDEEATLLPPYTFTIQNICNNGIAYNINLEIMKVEDEKQNDIRLSSSYVASSFNGNSKKIISSLESVEPTYKKSDYTAIESRRLATNEKLGSKERKSYTLNLWLDETAEDSVDVMNKSFISKITVSASYSTEPIYAYFLDGQKIASIPTKDVYLIKTECNGEEYNWDYEEWKLNLTNPREGLSCKINFISPRNFSEYIIYKSSMDQNIILKKQPETEQTGTNAIEEYRFIGKNPNNYICLEEDGICEENELYRIIGVIPTQKEENGIYENRIKLIKNANYVGETALDSPDVQPEGKGYRWDDSKNNWNESSVKKLLNEEYLDNIRTYIKYIDPAKWYLGGHNQNESRLAKEIYNRERSLRVYENNPAYDITKIGLIYGSDFAYATSGGNTLSHEECLNIDLSQWDENIECYENNWLYVGTHGSWLITHNNLDNGLSGYYTNKVNYNGWIVNPPAAVRPTFYLKYDTKYKDGVGSIEHPYLIDIE